MAKVKKLAQKETVNDGYDTVADIEIPTLSLKSIGDGESVVVHFTDELISRDKANGEEGQIHIAHVFDPADGTKKAIVLPYKLKEHWDDDALQNKLIRLTRVGKSGRTGVWKVQEVKPRA